MLFNIRSRPIQVPVIRKCGIDSIQAAYFRGLLSEPISGDGDRLLWIAF
jgi:hypothetical protein